MVHSSVFLRCMGAYRPTFSVVLSLPQYWLISYANDTGGKMLSFFRLPFITCTFCVRQWERRDWITLGTKKKEISDTEDEGKREREIGPSCEDAITRIHIFPPPPTPINKWQSILSLAPSCQAVPRRSHRTWLSLNDRKVIENFSAPFMEK